MRAMKVMVLVEGMAFVGGVVMLMLTLMKDVRFL